MNLEQNFVKYLVRFWAMEFQEKLSLRFTDLYQNQAELTAKKEKKKACVTQT